MVAYVIGATANHSFLGVSKLRKVDDCEALDKSCYHGENDQQLSVFFTIFQSLRLGETGSLGTLRV